MIAERKPNFQRTGHQVRIAGINSNLAILTIHKLTRSDFDKWHKVDICFQDVNRIITLRGLTRTSGLKLSLYDLSYYRVWTYVLSVVPPPMPFSCVFMFMWLYFWRRINCFYLLTYIETVTFELVYTNSTVTKRSNEF